MRDTLSFCIMRTGGYIQFGADPPRGPNVITTPLFAHSKYARGAGHSYAPGLQSPHDLP